jgi:hypothetical protein
VRVFEAHHGCSSLALSTIERLLPLRAASLLDHTNTFRYQYCLPQILTGACDFDHQALSAPGHLTLRRPFSQLSGYSTHYSVSACNDYNSVIPENSASLALTCESSAAVAAQTQRFFNPDSESHPLAIVCTITDSFATVHPKLIPSTVIHLDHHDVCQPFWPHPPAFSGDTSSDLQISPR